MQKLLLVDGNSLINRAYYATSLTNGATYGFLNMFLKELIDLAPTHVAVAFDVRAKTFRHEMFKDYKAGRKPMPDDLAAQLTDLKTLLDIMGIKMFSQAGFEADDIIGTLSKTAKGFEVIVLTADRDMLQLIDENVRVVLTKTGVTNVEVYDVPRIYAEFGVMPTQLIDVKALMGDKSDNIPGVAGIGEKTALKLVQSGADLDAYAEYDMCYALAKIKCDMELNPDWDALKFAFPLSGEVFRAFKERRFNSICARTNLFSSTGSPVQQSFF